MTVAVPWFLTLYETVRLPPTATVPFEVARPTMTRSFVGGFVGPLGVALTCSELTLSRAPLTALTT